MKKHTGIFTAFLLAFVLLLIMGGKACCEDGTENMNSSGIPNRDAVVDPVNDDGSYSTVIYDITSGLPTSEANCITETSEGFIWIGSYGGLIRYDGDTFMRMDSTSGLVSVKFLLADHLDRLWIGTNDNGVAMMENGVVRMWGKADGLRSTHIRAIAQDSARKIYVATSHGTVMFDEDLNLIRMDDPRVDEANMRSLRKGPDGACYGITYGNELFTILDGKLISFTDLDDYGLGTATAAYPDPYNPGYVFIGTEDAMICYGKLGSEFEISWVKDSAPLAYTENFEYINGRLWLCTRNGVGIFDGETFRLLDHLPIDNSIGHVMTDYEGNLWFTSTRQGVMKIVPNRFTDIFSRYGIEEEVVNSTCLYEDKLFVGSDNGLIVIGDNGRIKSIPLSEAKTASGVSLDTKDLVEYLEGRRIRSIIRDSKDRIWISTWHERGLLRYEHGKLLAFTENDGLYSNSVRAVYECKDGRILVANIGGVSIIEGDRITGGYGSDIGIVNTETLSVCEGVDGDIILGSNGDGIYIIHDGYLRHFSTDEGLMSDAVMRVKYDEKRQVFWIVTGNSLAAMDRDYNITTLNNFPFSNNFDLYENSKGELWILSGNGIYVLPGDELLANEEMDPVHYSIGNGLSSIATANSYSELTENGDLYIAGNSGVVKVNIENSVESVNDLKAAVPFIEADGVRVDPDENGDFRIAAGVQKLTIYSYVFNYSLIDPMVSYHLEGFDQQSTTVNRSELVPADYTNLRGGTYTFVMEMKDPMTNEVKTVSTKIEKEMAYYERAWFNILMLLLLVTLVVSLISVYFREKIRRIEQKNKEEAEKQRLGQELRTANLIQDSMLPSDFPAFPDRNDFDIFAAMDPAKEVGGDFYDFFLVDEDHLCMVMADVSGKGIPAALVMMISKAILQSYVMLGQSPGEALKSANESICANNKVDMFVTIWLGILELSTGKLIAANAGHEYPAIMRAGGKFELFKDKHGFVVGGMEGISYKEYELELAKGDKIFLYTDGVPEATDSANTLFGTDRMINALNVEPGASPEGVLMNVRKAVDDFVKEAEQFDDLTMLCMEYKKGGE